MEFWTTIVGLLRRPVVMGSALVVAAGLALLAFVVTPPTYYSSTTMVLTTTEYGGTQVEDPTEPTALTNPLLNFNGSLQTTSAILIQTLSTAPAREQLGADGPTTLIVNDGRTNPDLLGLSGPFLYLEGRSSSGAGALRVVEEAKKLMQEKLEGWQRDLHAPPKTYVSLVDVVAPTAPLADNGRVIKFSMFGFMLGLGLCLGLFYISHQVRARRRAAAVEVASTPGPTPDPVGEAAEREKTILVARTPRREIRPAAEARTDKESQGAPGRAALVRSLSPSLSRAAVTPHLPIAKAQPPVATLATRMNGRTRRR